MIKANAHKYGASALCKFLKISKRTYYYEAKIKQDGSELAIAIVDIFKASRNNYGTRKLKIEPAIRNLSFSRRGIGRIMNQKGLHQTIPLHSLDHKKPPVMNPKCPT